MKKHVERLREGFLHTHIAQQSQGASPMADKRATSRLPINPRAGDGDAQPAQKSEGLC